MEGKKIIILLNKLLKMLYLSLFFFTPLLISPFTSELFEFNKMLFIYFIASLVLFFWLFRMIFLKKIILKRTKLDLPIFIFLVSQLFSTFFSLDFHTSFFGYYGRFNGGLLSIITYLLLFYGFVSNFGCVKKTKNFFFYC
jgi:putative inorganic carbon (HCO3(-)) transporter